MKKSDNNSESKQGFDSENKNEINPKLSRREALKRIANKSLGVAILTLPTLPAFSFVSKQENEQIKSTYLSFSNIGDKENLYLDNYETKCLGDEGNCDLNIVYSPDGCDINPYSGDAAPDPYNGDCGADEPPCPTDYSSYSSIYSSYSCYYGI